MQRLTKVRSNENDEMVGRANKRRLNNPLQMALTFILATVMFQLFIISSLEQEKRHGTSLSSASVVLEPLEPILNTSALKKERRNKAIFCGSQHSPMVMQIIRQDFGYQEIPRSSKNWDLIYGGYPHCGDSNGRPPLDWEMKTGLNNRLNDEGWSNLKPHQIWFPCMGCKKSYCEKNGLCSILREFDPSSCYLLPKDLDRLKANMDGNKLWVLKRDGFNLHLHVGSGVSYIKSADDLPRMTQEDGYLVQPYMEPFLGQGQYRRKAEIKIYLALTSIHPLRLYAYTRMWVVLAGSIYTSGADVDNLCIHDNHPDSKRKCDGGLTLAQRQISFEDYAKKTNMTDTMRDSLAKKMKDMLGRIVHGANPYIQKFHVNEGIRDSGASCFSYMRADFGVTDEGEPILFEINEFPFTNGGAPVARQILVDSHRELFEMLGLDAPPVYGAADRAMYEESRSGQWELVSPP